MKKNLLLVTASIVALGASVPAFGADLAARPHTKAPPMVASPIYDWSGFYVGINGGWGSSHSSWDVGGVGLGSHDASGGTVGGQIGYRWQMGQIVFGVEGQGNWADFSGSHVDAFDPTQSDHSKVDSFGLITGQIGYAFNNVLLYAKGGAAVTDNKYRVDTAAGLSATADNETRWGGAIGAGVEVAFAPNWSVGVEYDHLFMQDGTVTFTAPGAAGSANISQDVDLVTARVNYKFGGPIIAKY